MHNLPNGAGLLEIARETLLGELLEGLPEERRYVIRMAANAMAIAAREAEHEAVDLGRELELLAGLYGAEVVEGAGAEPRERVREMNRRFARDIRDGIFDGACAPGVRSLLLEQICARLRISNPKYLTSRGLE